MILVLIVECIVLAGGIAQSGIASSVPSTPTELSIWLATDGASISGMTQTEALRQLVARREAYLAMAAEQDTTVAMLCFVFDDNHRSDWDSSVVFTPAHGHWKYVAALTVEPQSCRVSTGGDTTQNLSLARIRALYRRGWSMGTVGWDEKGSLYSQYSGKVATGAFTSENAFYNNLYAAVLSQRDTLGIGAPKWVSWSFSSATGYQERAARRAGIYWGFTGIGGASGDAVQGWRPNSPWLYSRWTSPETFVGGDTTSDGILCSALPGRHDDPMQVTGVVGENTDSLTFKRVVTKAVQNKALVIWCGHDMATWDLNLDGHLDGPGGTNDGKMRTASNAMSWLTKTFVKTGKLRVVSMDDGFSYYYGRPISPTANWINTEFEDFDHWYMNPGQTNRVPDGWWSWTNGATPSGRVKPKISWPKTGGYGGHKYVTMKWAPNVAQYFWNFGPTKRPWFDQNFVGSVFPPQGGNWIAHLEYWAIVDTTVAGWSAGVAPQVGDSVGTFFYGLTAGTQNDYAAGAVTFQLAGSQAGGQLLLGGNPYEGPLSVKWGATIAANGRKFNARNNAHRAGREWAHVMASWRYPADTEVLCFNLWKGNNIPTDAVRVSYPYLYFEKMSTSPVPELPQQ